MPERVIFSETTNYADFLLPHQIVLNRKIIKTTSEEGHYGVTRCADYGLAGYVETGIEKCRHSRYLFEFVDSFPIPGSNFFSYRLHPYGIVNMRSGSYI